MHMNSKTWNMRRRPASSEAETYEHNIGNVKIWPCYNLHE